MESDGLVKPSINTATLSSANSTCFDKASLMFRSSNCQLLLPDQPDYDFCIRITPEEGFYRGIPCLFRVSCPMENTERGEMQEALFVQSADLLFHPNIFPTGVVNLDAFDKPWEPGMPISALVTGLLSLLVNPDPRGCRSNPHAASLLETDVEKFCRQIR